MYPIVLDIKKIGVSRKIIVEALHSEGLDGISEGFSNIHLLPMFQKKLLMVPKDFLGHQIYVKDQLITKKVYAQ